MDKVTVRNELLVIIYFKRRGKKNDFQLLHVEIAVLLKYTDTNRIQIRKFCIAFQGDLHEFDINIRKKEQYSDSEALD